MANGAAPATGGETVAADGQEPAAVGSEWALSGPQRGVFEVWRSRCGDRSMPARGAFDPAAIGPWLSWIIWTEVDADPFDIRYRVVGDSVRSRLKRNPVGQRMSDHPAQGAGSEIWRQYRSVAETAAPLFAPLEYVGDDILVERVHHLLLPWGDDRVSNILAVCAFVPRIGEVSDLAAEAILRAARAAG